MSFGSDYSKAENTVDVCGHSCMSETINNDTIADLIISFSEDWSQMNKSHKIDTSFLIYYHNYPRLGIVTSK